MRCACARVWLNLENIRQMFSSLKSMMTYTMAWICRSITCRPCGRHLRFQTWKHWANVFNKIRPNARACASHDTASLTKLHIDFDGIVYRFVQNEQKRGRGGVFIRGAALISNFGWEKGRLIENLHYLKRESLDWVINWNYSYEEKYILPQSKAKISFWGCTRSSFHVNL